MRKGKYKYEHVCFGGTFDIPLHKGHRALIRKAFEIGRFCYIGLTSDFYVFRMKLGLAGVHTFEERKRNLTKFLTQLKISKKRYKISMIDRFYGDELIDPHVKIDAIVVSEETLPQAKGINMIREDLGLKPLEIVMIPMVLADDKRSISSRRIRAGEIDKDGKVKRKQF
ncbi:MAG: pantetheine-phosphate adenylyltransferase [Candidatus Aenigmarchaeota archaeon]|nr:pantetheine-phosphate adenylyltransferase [Candidatus Aenigmarchaeota archaeon]